MWGRFDIVADYKQPSFFVRLSIKPDKMNPSKKGRCTDKPHEHEDQLTPHGNHYH